MQRNVSSYSLRNKTTTKSKSTPSEHTILQQEPISLTKLIKPQLDNFRDLVFDLLQAQGQILSFRLLVNRGLDGALDLVGQQANGGFILVECKTHETLTTSKQALKYFGANVLEFLQLKNTTAPCYEHFQPWRETSIKEYIYCLPYAFKTDSERKQFKKAIEKTLAQVAKGSGRNDLATLTVTLYDWPDIVALLKNHPSLSLKWLNTKEQNKDMMRYYDYLEQHALPYISRDHYRATHPEAHSFITETDILERLLNDDKKYGCLIYGERGMGKTRLMREIGERAKQSHWNVWASINDLSEIKKICENFIPGEKNLLLLDNIDGMSLFDHDIFTSLQTQMQEGMLKMVINCRRTPISLLSADYSPGFWSIDLGLSGSPIEQDYRRYVSQQILAAENTAIAENGDFYLSRPAFAVFLHFIQTQFRKKYPTLQFTKATNFNEWLASRLPLSFPGQDWQALHHEHAEIFYIFALLPTSAEVTRQLEQNYSHSITQLVMDGWLDETRTPTTPQNNNKTKGLRVIFELIADEILKCRLDFCIDRLTQEILDIFGFAIRYNCFEPCFRSFERLADWPVLKQQSGLFLPILSQLIKQYDKSLGNGSLFILTPLMTEEEIVHLMADHPDFFADTTNNPDFPFKFSFLIHFFAKKKKKGESIGAISDFIARILAHWFPAHPRFCESSHICLRLLSACLYLFGKNAILWTDGPVLEQLVKDNLRRYSTEKNCVFLIVAWLDTGGEPKLIRTIMEQWLNRFPTITETSYVINAWLDAKGEKECIQNAIKMWLSNFGILFEANFLIRKWLETGGKTDVIKHGVKIWLQNFPQLYETHIVISTWLRARGDREWVKEAMITWLNAFPIETDSNFLFSTWLEVGGEPEVIRPYILPWLQKYATVMEDTSFVLKTWLNYGGDANEVAHFIFYWLDHYYQCFEATYVIEAWLNNTNNLHAIQPQTFKWLKIYKDHKDADFVIKRICRSHIIPDDTMMDIIFWCRKYADYDEVLFKLDNLIRNHIFNPLIAADWLLEIISHWIAKDSLSPLHIVNLESIMYNLLRHHHFVSGDHCTQVYIEWFLSPHSFREEYLTSKYNFLQVPKYFFRYHFLLTKGKMVCHNHSYNASIRKFLNWVKGWQPEVKEKIAFGIHHIEALMENKETI